MKMPLSKKEKKNTTIHKQESCAIAKMTITRYISGSNEPLRRYGHSKLSKTAACRKAYYDIWPIGSQENH